MPEKRFRALVLSDLHAFEGEWSESSPSRMNFGAGSSRAQSRVTDCARAVTESFDDGIDVVLLGGDLSDRADPEGLLKVWELTQQLAESLDARLIATAGNHDYDSRGQLSANPRGNLVGLVPPFPSHSEAQKLQYFTYDFAIESNDQYVVVTINSAAQHGYSYAGGAEHEHGRIMPSTIDRIDKALEGLGALPSVKIVLVHHHVIQLPDFDTQERSIMVDSQDLISMLEKHGDWVIVHGHKHRPYLHYAQGFGSSPLVFSAGSFAANLGFEFHEVTRCQFYVMELLQPTELDEHQLSLAGTVFSWTYDLNSDRWVKAAVNDGLPARSGFGWHHSPHAMASSIAGWVAAGGGQLSGADLLSQEPKLNYLTPVDLENLTSALERKNVVLSLNGYGDFDNAYTRERV